MQHEIGGMMNSRIEIGRTICLGENGSRHVVLHRQEIINDPRYGKAKGPVDYVTSAGLDVNQLADGRFQVLISDEILTPVSS